MGRVELQVKLANGQSLTSVLDSETVMRDRLGLEGEPIYRVEGLTEQEKALSIAATALALRLEQGSGFFTLTDGEGFYWLVPTVNIVAGAVRDPDDPDQTGKLTVGYRPPSE